MRAAGDAPVRVLRFAWDAPSDVARAHVFTWEVQWAEVADCEAALPTAERWPGRSLWTVEELDRLRGGTHALLQVRAAAHLRVRAQLLGTQAPGPWTAPVCGAMTALVSVPGGVSGPVVTEARIVSAPSGAGGVWRAGDAVEAHVRFSEAVTVDTSGGVPTLEVVLGEARRKAVYVGGSGTQALRFRHVVEAEDDGARGPRGWWRGGLRSTVRQCAAPRGWMRCSALRSHRW